MMRWHMGFMVCGQGQQVYVVENPAVLDKFSCDTVFWYAGDFDPEGLLIAQKLKLRYGERLNLWMYKKRRAVYQESIPV